ncbi:MAG: hypothetical protein J6Y20_11520 [Lachnospiraceae bacterium]|nr:hypothetical protein [Lachnospiraceae bacterium]
MSEERKPIELDEEFIVLAVPASTLELEISATVWIDGKPVDVSRHMPFDEVRAAIKEAQEGYIPSDAIFSLTELGEKELERLREKYAEPEDV